MPEKWSNKNMANPLFSEVGPATPRPPEKIQEGLEGAPSQSGIFARRVSALARVRNIRNAHISRLGSIFFTTNKFGKVVFYPVGGRMLINELFIKPAPAYTIPSSRI